MKRILALSVVLASLFTGCYTIVIRDAVVYQEVYPLPPHPPPCPLPPAPPPQRPIIEYVRPVSPVVDSPATENPIRDSGAIRTDRQRDKTEERNRSNTERGSRVNSYSNR